MNITHYKLPQFGDNMPTDTITDIDVLADSLKRHSDLNKKQFDTIWDRLHKMFDEYVSLRGRVGFLTKVIVAESISLLIVIGVLLSML